MEVVHAAVVAAAGDALNPVSIGLNIVSDVLGWMNQGADLDLDIVPTIENLSRGKHHSINSWRFFANAVSAAKAARERGLPTPTAEVVSFRRHDAPMPRMRSDAELFAQLRAEGF